MAPHIRSILDRTSRPIPLALVDTIEYLAAPPTPLSLAFAIERQEQTLWCWAAVAVSIETYYAGSSQHTQCALATRVLDTPCCDPPGCNRPWHLDFALRWMGHLEAMDSGSASVLELESELSRGRVVGAQILWRGGGGHFVAIDGLRRSPQGAYISVADPEVGATTELLAAEFESNYEGVGTWAATYRTQA